ncbi:MAG: CHAT domain-containing protein [Candidatus Aminicenantes bacterium]|nr:CHAT domain-containing protein [Candidatus Aminicenantes bacterium]
MLITIASLFFTLYCFSSELYPFNKADLEQEYSQLFTVADKFRKDGKFEESLRLFEKSLSVAKIITDKKKECASLLKLGLLYWNIGLLKDSSVHYENALKSAQKLNLKDLQVESQKALEIYRLYEEGKKFRSSGEYLKSIESFQQAIDLARETASKEHELKCLRQMSVTCFEQNNLQRYFSFSKDALNIAQNINHRKEEGNCLYNIGLYYWKLDNYSKALNCFEDALKIALALGNIEDESACLTNIGGIYVKIGNYNKALEYLRRALTIDRQLGNNVYICMDLNSIGTTFRTKGLQSGNKEDFNKALYYYKDCLKIIKEVKDKRTEVEVLNNLGAVHTDLENYNEAVKFFESGYEMAEEIKDIEMMGMILNNIGIVHYNQGNYETSTEYFQKAIDIALKIEGGKILWEAYMEIARAYEKQNKFKEAKEYYEGSIECIEKGRSQIELEELKARYLGTDKRIDAYHYLIHLLVTFPQSHVQKKYNLEAFNYLERAKARSFLDSLELSNVSIPQEVDFKLQNKEKELMKEISKFHAKLLAVEQSSGEKNVIDEKLKNKENELESLQREMRIKSSKYKHFNPETVTLDEAQRKLLDSKTAFFAYSLGKEHSYAFVITKKDFSIFPLPSKEIIQTQVSDYLKVISDKEKINFQLGYELFKTLVFPGLDKSIKSIIFIPDDILHFLPFGTLITHKEKRDWLIKDYKIAYAPSISSLREIIQRKKSNDPKPQMDILAFGDPFFGPWEVGENGSDIFQNYYSSNAFNFFRLKYSGFEIDKISSLFKKRKRKIFRREEASKEQLINHSLDNYKIIHFATHSIVDEKIPARSSIVLSLDQDLTQDGFLQMREIYNLKLNSDLVTLSSCQTGLGEFIKGEGIEGINRAFFYAGASSVLMSLWAVNDQASYQLMERFYFHLRSSESIMSSLRKAKLEMIDSSALSHPYYWAGFIVSGKADEVVFPHPVNKWFFFGISFILVAGIIFAAVKSLRKNL